MALIALLLSSAAFAAPIVVGAAPARTPLGAAWVHGGLQREIDAASTEFGVPSPVLSAVAWEASHWNPEIRSEWGGYGLFDLREGDQDPSLEHAAALLEVDPNAMIGDWRLQVRGAAAILADQAREANAGSLPSVADTLAWWNAVRAFSGREEPLLQDQYARYIFETLDTGAEADTVWGTMRIAPEALDLTGLVSEPPPTSPDSSLAYQFYAACSDNYSDYSRTASDIDMIVIHTVEGSYSGCYSWFANCSAEASAHYVVRSSDGQITQSVKEADVAWHAGDWDTNLRSIGIEHEGYVSDCSYYTDAMYEGSANLVLDIAARQGISISRSYIIGHEEVPGCADGSGGGSGCHTDPGPCWDWDYYMSLLNGGTGTSGGEIIGAVRDSDIYNGASLIGATVWIAETGETTTVGDDGFYRFEDEPFSTYTMHATYPGYAEGTCTKTTSSSQDWCSIALYPSDGGQDSTPVDTGGVDSSPTGDSGGTVTPGPVALPPVPGELVLQSETGGCTSAPVAPERVALPIAGLAFALVARRRRAAALPGAVRPGAARPPRRLPR